MIVHIQVTYLLLVGVACEGDSPVICFILSFPDGDLDATEESQVCLHSPNVSLICVAHMTVCIPHYKDLL